MSTVVKGIYKQGVIRLKGDRPEELQDDTEVEVVIPSAPRLDPDDPTGWKALDRLCGSVEGAPPGMSEEHDRYLYGDACE
jgi:hypothetical protein